MLRKAYTVQYQLGFDRVEVIGIHRSDRGSKYRGRSYTISKEGKSKEEFSTEVQTAVAHLIDGTV